MLNKQSIMYFGLGYLAAYYLLPVVAEKVGLGALALKPNAGHMGALAYKKNRRNPRYGSYGAVHKMGMHPKGAIHLAGMHKNAGHMGAMHMNPGHMGALHMNPGHMGALHLNPFHG